MAFDDEFNRYRVDFEEYLKNYMNTAIGVGGILSKSVNYSLFSGGKRIRPILMLAFCDLFGGDSKNVYPFACALEMIHTYSLIHDDLPCMDNDVVRRGKPCNHIEFGEDIALLAGDGLLTEAFGTVSSFDVGDKLRKNQIKSINILSSCAGMHGMIAGQCHDLKIDIDNASAEDILEMYRLKTSRLFRAASEIGALMSGAEEREMTLAGNCGEKLGIAFQLVDDILDDEYEILSVFSKETPNALLERLTNEAKECVEKIGGKIEFLLELTDYLTQRTC